MATPFRYWRYKCTRWLELNVATTSGATRVSELQFITAANVVHPTSSLTSATAPSPYVATSSGELDSGNAAWKAFDGTISDSNRYMSASGGAVHLTIDLGTAVAFNRVRIAPDNAVSSNYYPLDFKIQASNTGSFTGEETTFLDVTNASGWVASTLREFGLFDPADAGHLDAAINIPMLGVSSYFGAAGRVTLPMPLVSSTASGPRVLAAAVALPMLQLESHGGGFARVTLPAVEVRSTGAQSNSGAEITLPMLAVNAKVGNSARVTLPALVVSSSATFVGWGSAAVSLPMLLVNGAGKFGAIGAAALTLPMMAASGRFGGSARLVLPAMTAAAGGKVGSIGAASFVLPRLVVSSGSTAQNYGRANIILPMVQMAPIVRAQLVLPAIQAVAIGGVVVVVSYEAYAVNLVKSRKDQPYEVTRYTSYPFTSIVRVKNAYYGVGPAGIYRLGGDTFDGAPIPTAWTTHLANFGGTQKKTPESMYISGRMGLSAVGSVADGEKATYAYPMANLRGEAGQVYRVKLGKGIKSNYLGFGVSDPTGGVMDVDLMDDRLPVMTRAI